jgi:uncharacterized iron-regulated membrane protein
MATVTQSRPQPLRAKRRFRGGTVRKATIKVHRWVALVVGLWIVLQAVSGSLMVFSDQFDAWSNPGLYHHTSGDVGPQAAVSDAVAAVPHGVGAGVQLPSNDTGVYVVTVSIRSGATKAAGSAPPQQRLVYVDPGTGRVNGLRDPNGGFTHWLMRLHGSLLQTKLLGVKGTVIVGWLGVIAIFVVLTGAYLWLWPAVRKMSTLFRLRRKSAMVFSLDLHRLIGIVVFPFLLLALVTGVNLTFQKELRQVWYDITPGADKGTRASIVAPKSGPHDPLAHRISLDQVRQSAVQTTGGLVDSISPPFTATGTFAVKITRGWDPASGPRGRGGNLTAYVDQYNGSVLRVSKPSDFPDSGQLYEYWAVPTHFGTEGGIATRILLDLTGIGTLAMIASGVSLTVVRRRKRVRRKAAIGQALPALPSQLLEETTQQSWIENVSAGTEIVHEGAPADAFYVILSGEFDVLRGDPGRQEHLAHLSAGQSFGEIGLMYTGTRTASVVATTAGELVVVPTEEFDLILRRAERDGIDLHAAGVAYASGRFARTPTPGK